jgi:phosphoribosylformylglycinamidine synthase
MMMTPQEIKDTQAWRPMGLKDEEYEKICQILDRLPNYTELGMYAVLWSEHCSYKHSRPLFKHFPTQGDCILVGPGENAGAVDIGDGLAIVMKVESHNHPSYVEPYEGAATGVGGILRDIFTMGARPIASLNSLRFGNPKDEYVRYLVRGVVAGIGDYGNATGVPTVAGEISFDESYQGNCLVNAMSVGLVRHDSITKATASGVGNPVMVVGSTTGRDGIHGATFASAEFSEENEEKRPSVQVGDPFTEKLLIEACLELIASGVVVGIQDMGAAGLTSSSSEMASNAGSGIEMDLTLVPQREEGMSAYEIMLSESQERMLVIPKAGAEEQVKEIFAKRGLLAVVVGKVTDDGMLRLFHHGELAAEVPAKSLTTDGAPSYVPPAEKPQYLEKLWGYDFDELPDLEHSKIQDTFLQLLGFSNIASRRWVWEQYDQMAQLGTIVGPGSDAGVLRIPGTKRGIALTIDCNGRYCYQNPKRGAALAVAEAARNIYASGAKPLAITDGLNLGSPERPQIYWQLKETVFGLAEACRALGTPVVGGNVSLYNETAGEAIFPTPVVGMLGVFEDVQKHATISFKNEGDLIFLVGENRNELSGSEYLKVCHDLVAGPGPKLDLETEKRNGEFCHTIISDGLVSSCHDLSEGGLAIGLAECALAGEIGAQVKLYCPGRTDSLLFGETQARFVISLSEENAESVRALAEERGVPLSLLGRVGGDKFTVEIGETRVIDGELTQISELWNSGLERLLGEKSGA